MAMMRDLLRYARATVMVGDILKRCARDVGLRDLMVVGMPDGEQWFPTAAAAALSDLRVK
jgi:hypothetical protein